MPISKRSGSRSRIVLAVIAFVVLPMAGLALYWLITLPDVSQLAKSNPSSTALIQTRLKEQARPSKPQWTWMPLSRISPHLQRAVIVAEDASFYQHEGFDWKGIRDAAAKDFESGRLQKGGSTITQQLAKNLYLSYEKTLLRKANEALITRSLERHLTKTRILEIYLNVVEWGKGVYGAEAAARHHFHKPARELTAEEAALLAAMLPAPRLYDPLRVTRYLSVRQQQILRHMGYRKA
ncbi:MAG TPA: monofunctional biosynthetic peptidoglycan transglycosylase [Nitrospiraceae bacterium]|nr:monofunctional biosynthetic peptidoglycan transglycosylase [Nitrospiraceae bacterium]